jgi:hypothetical protein
VTVDDARWQRARLAVLAATPEERWATSEEVAAAVGEGAQGCELLAVLRGLKRAGLAMHRDGQWTRTPTGTALAKV